MGESDVTNMRSALSHAVFLDRDGVINRAFVREGRPFPPQTVEDFEILDGVAEGCRRLKDAGFLLIVITNQPDVGRGIQKRATIEAMHKKMRALLPLDRVEICYHVGPSDPCECRKPAPGMIARAATHFCIDLAKSFVIGDRWRDIDCGHAAGTKTILIDYRYAEKLRAEPNFRVESFAQAVEVILQSVPIVAK
jgi:D-glycero-D-manno-heptose 1,7-bisphosphate phosphatase